MQTTYVDAATAPLTNNGQIKLHAEPDFEGMRKAGRMAAEALDMLVPMVQPGVTTEELDSAVLQFASERGAVPAPLNYRGFPKSICTSVNHVVCHGIPGNKALKEGEIVNIDVTLIVDGWHGDSSRMYPVGQINRRAERLIEVTYECLMRGLEVIRPGALPAISATPSRPLPRPSAVQWCATFAVTGWAGCSTTCRTSCTMAEKAKASSCAKACSSPSSR
jgi:methionyl aminopeptidase